jgi:hypothetical protein
MRLFKLTLLLAGLLGFAHSLALADTSPADPTKDPAGALNQLWGAVTEKKYGLAAVIATMLFVAFARFAAPRIHGKFGAWINTTRVSAALAFIGGTASALAWKLMAGTPWSMNIVVWGFGIGVAAIGGYNAFFDLIFPNDKKPATTADTAAELAKKVPPPIRPGALLPLAFIALACASCAHMTPDERAFGASYGACMEAKGLAAAPAVGQEAWNDLNNGTDKATIVAQLEALAKTAGQDAVACAVEAWLTPAPGAPHAAKNPAGVEAANAFLKKSGATTVAPRAALSPPRGYRPRTGALGA